MTTPAPEYGGLIERLEAEDWKVECGDGSHDLRQDPHEAAKAIRDLEAERDRLRRLLGKLLANLDGLDDYMKQPERGGYGVECAVCMNEWLEPDDRADMEEARSASGSAGK